MKCEAAARFMDGYRTGELQPWELADVAAHLESCGSCARMLEDLRALADSLRERHYSASGTVLERILSATGDRYAPVETDVGRIWVGFNSRAITMVYPGAQPAESFERIYEKRTGRHPQSAPIPENYSNAVRLAAAGRAPLDVPVDLSSVSPFERDVLQILRQIPRGEVRPYAWLAREAGRPRAVRAIGNTMARNPVPLLLPCHRVVPAAGGVGNYAFGSALKRELLIREGVPVGEIERLARKGVRYLGCKSTNVFCFPTCHDIQRAKPENRIPFRSPAEAGSAGYRPCRHCCP